VFGTEKRGIELPVLAPNYESSLPGIFIAGELGGMGLIRNAIEQGTKAMLSVEEVCKSGHSIDNDVVIVGAGPAGFSSTLYAKSKNMKYVTIEQESLGGTVFQFPRGKLVMTAPVDLPMVGKVKIKETTKEELLSFWENIEKESGISINYKERVVSIEPSDSGYVVNTTKGKYPTRTVLLAIGRRGTPRKLGVPGEELSKVVYRLIDPEQYVNQHVLVIGGGDSALEAALAISEQPGTTVSLSYRSEAFGRAKKKNREKIALASKSERINLLMKSNVISFDKESVKLDYAGSELEIPNDAALICAGGILPTGFLNEIGITVETKHGTA
jgi:thioredoxin reductase